MKESDAINPTDNAHLAQEYLEALDGASTKYRRRFFEGTFVEEIEDALWTYDRLDACRVSLDEVPDLQRIVVAIDPSGARGPEDTRSDEIGIIVAGKGVDGLCYVLEDLTIRDKPEVRARRAVHAYHKWRADAIIGEINYGGALVAATIRNVDANIPYVEVLTNKIF